ncbi:MFS transporter, partial [Devosia limi DSM 17137]
MTNKVQIFAYDSDRSRLAPIYYRLKRNAARNVQVRAPQPDALEDLVAKTDRAVIDAACTRTGPVPRRPEPHVDLPP